MRICALVAGVLIASAMASAQIPAFTLSGGYAHLHTGRQDGLFYNKDGDYIDGDLAWRIPDAPFPLLLGGSFSGSGYFADRDIVAPGSNGQLREANLDSSLGLYCFEGRVSFPIALPMARGLFIMPRLGTGLLIDDYAIDRPINANGFTKVKTDEHIGAAYELRPALQIGYAWGLASIGGEVSYMAAWGDFGRLGATAGELRAGIFLRVRY